jgi:tetratricopeptide (TPR) repeat protein
LLKASYERCIALEQYQTSYFVSLAGIVFENGENSLGLKILQLMINLGDKEKSTETAAEIASLPWVKSHAVEDPRIEKPEASNSIRQIDALLLASETTAEYRQLDAAIGYRKQLQSLNAEDEETRIELACLLAEKGKYDEAVSQLASIISDRKATRNLRWKAIWLAPEIIGERRQLWTMLEQRVQAVNPKDTEMAAAVKAISSSATGQTVEAIRLINNVTAENPNSYSMFFRGLLEKQNRQYSDALKDFSSTLTRWQGAREQLPFNITEDDSLRQLIRLYVLTDSPGAALKISEADPDLKINIVNSSRNAKEENESKKTEAEVKEIKKDLVPATLRNRSEKRRTASRIELLGLLSEASERTGDLNRAVDFEKTRLALLSTTTDRKRSESRIDRLTELRRERSSKRAVAYTVDQRLVAQR